MRALALLAVLACVTPAKDDAGPAIGRFLIARPQVGGFFAETVIVLVDHAETGSLGLIVNRPIDVSVAELLPELEGAREHGERGFLGGPVATSQLLLLVRAAAQPPGAAPVLDHVFVSGSPDTLRALLEKEPAGSEFRAYVGYAGWAPGQLDAEIARGDWLVAPGDAASVFTHEPGELWKTLLKKHEMIPVQWLPPRRTHPPSTSLVVSRGVQQWLPPRRPHPAAPFLVVSRGVQGWDPVVARAAKSINLSPPWRSAAASSASPTSGRARSSTR